MAVLVDEGEVKEIFALAENIPEFSKTLSLEALRERLADRASYILIARVEEKPVAFKVGYALSRSIFYSWLGGVLPENRRQGIACQLRLVQEAWALRAGYETIQVKSMNRFPAMLKLLIGADYQICGYENLGDAARSKIIFEKNLRVRCPATQ